MIDGACAGYITPRKENKNVTDTIFMKGNSSVNIRNGSNLVTRSWYDTGLIPSFESRL